MPKLTWTVINVTQANLNITQYVRSLNFTLGRPTALSPYSGNSASITMNSYGGIENYVAVNDEILLSATGTGGTLENVFKGWVASRNYDDQPGTGVNSTMIININDSMLQAGMANFQNQSLVSVNNQPTEIDNLLPQINFFSDETVVNISTGTFTTNANQRLNEIISGDRGILFNADADTYYHSPTYFNGHIDETFTIGRTTSATQIAYQDLVRVEAASNSLFYTQATVTGSASTVTSTNTTAQTFYGTRTFTATTAQSNLVSETAGWYANTFTDPETVMLNLSFSDVAQNQAALNLFNHFLSFSKFVSVSYTPPGGVSTTGYFYPEEITVNATTSQTTIDMVMTPLTYYANFILNDAVFGVLDTDRLGV